ncbi:MAG: MBL fold metallo-hydrolase [Terriglobales bacterium]|jgi:glyoxylase-like metal-dependent hydrolase (beta-lactamase superfamily II)
MASDSKSFKVGDIECVAVNDGTFSYPIGWLFSNVPAEQVENSLRERKLPETHVESPFTCLLVKTGKHKVLIDTGAEGLAPTAGNLLKNLAAERISPEEITDVVLTHGHPDHIGGVLNGSGPAFPNARYLMSRTEWDFWNDPSVLHDSAMGEHMKQMLVGCAQKNLPPLKDRIELLDGEKEVVPGILAIPAPGHTPGHIALLIVSSGAQLLHMSDAVLNPLHMENPDWRNVFDLDPADAVSTRQRLLDRAAADKVSVLAYHFPFPGMGRVTSKGHAWAWQAGVDADFRAA